MQGIEAERAEIARDVHDEIGSALTALGFDLAWLEREATSPAVRQRLRNAMASLAQAKAATQAITLRLAPAPLEHGLAAALQELARGFEQRAGTPVRVSVTTPVPDVPDDVAVTVYRIAQEALTNAGKHARCHEASVALSLTGRGLCLRVEDDGIGIDLTAPSAGQQGLRGMRARTRSVHGSIVIGRRNQGGTAVTLTVPLRQDTGAPSVALLKQR